MCGKANLKTYVIIPVFLLGVVLLYGCDKGPSEDELKEQGFIKLPYPFGFSTSNPNPSTVGFDGPFPEMPSEMMVYKVIHPNNINESYVRELAQKHFGMPPDAQFEKKRVTYLLKSSTHRFRFETQTGFFTFEKIDRIDTRSVTRNDYPSNEDCKTIAVKYLKEHKLYEDEAYFSSVVDHTRSFGAMTVGFGRKIDGYDRWGYGGGMSVRIGPGGEVVRVRKSWQELVPYKPYPIKTARQALRDLHNRRGFLKGRKGKIKNITIRYYISAEKQDYIQPNYDFECTGPLGVFYGCVPAIKKGYIQSRKEYFKEMDKRREEALRNSAY